jgi:hypothetical protein
MYLPYMKHSAHPRTNSALPKYEREKKREREDPVHGQRLSADRETLLITRAAVERPTAA